jgi:hypothetical protein
LFITDNKQISIRMRIKVWIQKIYLFFILKLLYIHVFPLIIFTVVIIYWENL